MAKNIDFAKKSFSELPQWAKGLISVAVVGGVGYLVYKLLQKAKESQSPEGIEAKEIENELRIDTSKQSYPLSQYSQMAQKIEAAGHDIGTDEESIYAVFRKIKSNKDFLLLKKAFGVRDYTGDILPFMITRNRLDLQGWIVNELSSSEVKKVNAILKNNKVGYSF
jgi:hypothetical protein